MSALFTAYAIEGVPPVEWGRKMVKEILPRAYKYLEEKQRDWKNYQKDLKYFENYVYAFFSLHFPLTLTVFLTRLCSPL